MDAADNQGVQSKVDSDRICIGVQTTIPGGLPLQIQPGEEDNDKDKYNQGDETEGQQPLNVGITATSTTDPDTEKTLNHRGAKRQKL